MKTLKSTFCRLVLGVEMTMLLFSDVQLILMDDPDYEED